MYRSRCAYRIVALLYCCWLWRGLHNSSSFRVPKMVVRHW